jgi:hypothetical protein
MLLLPVFFFQVNGLIKYEFRAESFYEGMYFITILCMAVIYLKTVFAAIRLENTWLIFWICFMSLGVLFNLYQVTQFPDLLAGRLGIAIAIQCGMIYYFTYVISLNKNFREKLKNPTDFQFSNSPDLLD